MSLLWFVKTKNQVKTNAEFGNKEFKKSFFQNYIFNLAG